MTSNAPKKSSKLKLVIEYDGSAFSGWQRQPNAISVQEVLEESLAVYAKSVSKSIEKENEYQIYLHCSGRTDAGVHAREQVATMYWPEELPLDEYKLKKALNGMTQRELCVREITLVDDSFDARGTPHVKSYKYYILNRDSGVGNYWGRVWYIPGKLDVPAMIRAAQLLCGEHDFSSFRAGDCGAATSVRTILRSEFTKVDKDLLVYTARGNGFLKQMIRIIVGTLVDVGQGRLTVDDIPRILEARDRTQAGKTAPPEGLVLDNIRYV